MKSRTDGMWWGTAIEAPNPGGLARFYAELLGWHIEHEEATNVVVAASPQGRSSYSSRPKATGLRSGHLPTANSAR